MNKKYQEISLIEFQQRFQSEEDCEKRLFELRWPDGFVCPRCGGKDYYNLPKRHLFQCKGCNYQTSLTAGTVMHGTRTPLLKWFWAIFLVSTDKRGYSALALSKKIGVSYWVAWTMLQKIRQGMRDRDSHYKLAGVIEMDDAFFGGSKEGGDKRGRGSSKIPVIVEASTNGEGIGYARMTVVDHVDGKTVKETIKANIKESQVIKTDGFSSYHVVKEEGHNHQREIIKGRKAHEVLKWIHILISNAKAFILGTFHGLDKKHLQAYLDEFCYRFNRRWFENQLFDRLVTACVTSYGITFSELTQ
jgi:transposase-like protein